MIHSLWKTNKNPRICEEPGLKYMHWSDWIQVCTNYTARQEVKVVATQETELKNTQNKSISLATLQMYWDHLMENTRSFSIKKKKDTLAMLTSEGL